MLSIQPLKSAQAAGHYYTQALNYYMSDSQGCCWQGQGAKRLGLSGTIEKSTFDALLAGHLPNGQQLKNAQGHHRPGVDLTFSAPKSVSILVGLDADPRLQTFHDQAVTETLKIIEQQFVETRLNVNQRLHFQKTGNAVFATFRQAASRSLEPQLHTHCVLLNMTQSLDGKWRSLASDMRRQRGVVEQLQQHAQYAGLIYRHFLAKKLIDVGYTCRATRPGLFEIDGMPQMVLGAFSTRRKMIENTMHELGRFDAKAASQAALMTRPNKQEPPLTELKQQWQITANTLGFDAKAFVANTQKQKSRLIDQLKQSLQNWFYTAEERQAHKATQALKVAIDTLSQKQACFTDKALIETVLKHTLVQSNTISMSAIESAIANTVKQGDLLSANQHNTHHRLYTTPWMLSLESETLVRVYRNQNTVASICTLKTIQSHIDDYHKQSAHPLTASQREAIKHVLHTRDRFIAIQGYAGTAKTSMLRFTEKVMRDCGYRCRGIAVTSSAANELTEKGHINADVFPIVHEELQRASRRSLQKTVFIVDEASMLSNPQGHELIKLIEQHQARLIIVGDRAQLPSIESGRLFGLLQDYDVPTTAMTDIVRQQSPAQYQAVAHATQKNIVEAVESLREIVEVEDASARIETCAKRWLALSPEKRDNTLIFAATHRHRHAITDIIRQQLQQEGRLSGDVRYHTALIQQPVTSIESRFTSTYSQGNVIRFNRAFKRYGIHAGEYLTVGHITAKHIKANQLPLIRENQKPFLFSLSNLPHTACHRAPFARDIEIYQVRQLPLQVGERILFRRNHRQENIRNSDVAIITACTDSSLTFRTPSGEDRTLPCDHPALNHIDHGYVLTNYSVQGKDSLYAIGLIESYNQHSTTLQNFYVQISRSIHDMTLITDDKERLITALDHQQDEKTAALDVIDTDTLKQHTKTAIHLHTVMDKKLLDEAIWQRHQHTLSAYQQAKAQNHHTQQQQLALQIVKDPVLFRLSLTSLSFHYREYQQDALQASAKNLRDYLPTSEREKLESVSRYCQVKRDVATRWASINKLTKKKQFVSHELMQQARDLTQERNDLAKRILDNLSEHKPYLIHYSIGQLNPIGIPPTQQHKEIDYAKRQLERLYHHALQCQRSSIPYPQLQQRQQQQLHRLQADEIQQQLMMNAKATYQSIFGEPSQQNAQTLRYAGGLLVSLKGDKAGCWFDFTNNTGGGPIQAIQHKQGLTFKAALDKAAELANIRLDDLVFTSRTTPKNINKQDDNALTQKRIQSAQSIWASTKPLNNTPADIYLKKHRGITETSRLEMRYWPAGAKWTDINEQGKLVTKTNKFPALVVAAKNKEGTVTGVQRIYLDPKTKNKNTFMTNPKLTKGVIKGSAGIIQTGKPNGKVYIAEGPETGASIALVKPDATVLVSLGIHNLEIGRAHV